MNKTICLDCLTRFEAPEKVEMPDHNGFTGIIINVCPVCISSNIQELQGLYTPIFDSEDVTGIERMANHYLQRCIENKFLTTDPTLLQHYTALIQQANIIVKKIKDAHQKI
jgi:hypothetical protein